MTRVALIAHDDEKPEMIHFMESHESVLSTFALVGTGTTETRITEATALAVERK